MRVSTAMRLMRRIRNQPCRSVDVEIRFELPLPNKVEAYSFVTEGGLTGSSLVIGRT